MPMSYQALTTMYDNLDRELGEAYSEILIQQDTLNDFADVIIDVYAELHLMKITAKNNLRGRVH